jgi:hypothetical protein
MAITISPGALPAPKKGTFYQVFLSIVSTPTLPILPVTWAVTSGALPAFLTLSKVRDLPVYDGSPNSISSLAVVQGSVPSTLNTGTWTATITATDSTPTTPLTATCVSTGVTIVADGPDIEGYHGTEANRTTILTVDAFAQGKLAVADALARAWPLSPPSQNS